MTTIALEFRRQTGNLAAFGTEVLLRLDGRWGILRRKDAIYNKVAELRKQSPGKYSDVHFVGYTNLGTHNYEPNHLDARMADHNPPAWV